MRKGIRILLMLLLAVLFVALSHGLPFSNSSGSDAPSCAAAISDRIPAPDRRVQGGQCDIFSGRWVWDPSGPAYTNLSCYFIGSTYNCLRNGRPDINYLYWRWKPYGCELPPFDSFKFINAMKDKSLVFIGDSISGSQFQSMLCLLSKIEVPILTYHDEAFRSMTLYFSNHNLTVAMIWSPFLVKSENFKAEDPMAEIKLHIDTIEEKWASQYNKYDYIVLSDGQWFLRSLVLLEDNVIVGCNYCKNSNLKELGIDYAYRKSLQMAYEFMSSSDHKPLILFRAWSPNHFEHGDWSNGGVCNRTSPYGEGQCKVKPADHLMRRVEIEEFQKAAAMSSRGRARLKQSDTFHLSLLRPDAHLGPYGTFHPFGSMDNKAEVQNDCIHWCVPGLVDTWNELIMKIVVDEGDVSYSYGDSVAFY